VKNLLRIAGCLILCLWLASCRPLSICCLGDSITQGRIALDSCPQLSSYRYYLWLKLDSAKYNVNFVGSTKALFKEDPDHRASYQVNPSTGHTFQPFHEGHWGWTTGNILDSLNYWLEGYKPDIILVHLGDNDLSAKIDSIGIAQNLKSIISILRMKNPEVKVLLARLITPWTGAVNNAVPLIAKKLSTQKSKVIAVDLTTGFINDPKLPGSMTVDWVHPNEKGARWMANRWYQALLPLLKK
jgi:acyl-CoA thioesterase I